jgi:hypothetical protein
VNSRPSLILVELTQFRSLQRQLDSWKQKCSSLENMNTSLQLEINACSRKVEKGSDNLSHPTLHPAAVDVRSKKLAAESLTTPLSYDIQEIMAELSVDQDMLGSMRQATQSTNNKEDPRLVNISSTSSNDSFDLQSIERRLKSLVQSAMNYDQR